MDEAAFRAKYPNSTDEQVALYLAAVEAEKACPPKVENLGPPLPRDFFATPVQRGLSSYSRPIQALGYLNPYAAGSADEMRHVISRHFTMPEKMRQQFENASLSASDMLAMLAGCPTSQEWKEINDRPR